MSDKTRSQTIAADIAALMRARNPLLWIVTREEARAERYLVEAAGAAGYTPRCWDVAQGVTQISGKPESWGSADPGDMLKTISARATNGAERGAWIMRDLPGWIEGPAGMATLRQLRNLARMLPTTKRESAQVVVILTPSRELPPEIAGHATVIDWPLPDRAEITAILDAAINALPDELKADAAPNGARESAIDAAVGLTGEETAACYAKSLVQTRKIDAAAISQEKRRIVAREGILEWFDPLAGGMAAVGGLDYLKGWLDSRAAAFTPAARAYGLPAPKGALLVGVPGCGKSLVAKAIATAWVRPLLRMDLGALKSKFVGESEGNLRKAFEIIEAIGPCVVWLDEIEKALQGATSGSADGGVSSDALGAILNWMQERRGEAFVIATANDVEGLPPELMRKGRFDDVWFVDAPTRSERFDILRAALQANGRTGDVDPYPVVDATAGFTGAEIAALVPEAMFTAFADGAREIEARDLVAAASTVVPLTRTAAEKIGRLRDWASTRARRASPAEETEAATGARKIDL